jgi:hypothetical protein
MAGRMNINFALWMLMANVITPLQRIPGIASVSNLQKSLS